MNQWIARFLRILLGRRIVRALRTGKLWAKQRLGLSFCHPVQVVRRVKLHGDPDYGGWRICPDGIDGQAIAYDFGVGEDTSFALSLIEEYGLRVWAFDPTPKSIQWFGLQPHPPQLIFHPYGIADFDGQATFFLPDNPNYVSGTLVQDGRHRGGSLQVPVKRLATIMAELEHRHLDILKLDVEGAEYAVLRDILRSRLQINQILVEFHGSRGRGDFASTRAAIEEVNRYGYRIFAVGHGTDFSFIRIDQTDNQRRRVVGGSIPFR